MAQLQRNTQPSILDTTLPKLPNVAREVPNHEVGSVIELTDLCFSGEVTKDPRPIMVCFYSNTCAPSHKVSTLLESFASTYSSEMRFAKLHIPDNPATVANLRITAIPTVRILHSGTTHWHFPGIPSLIALRDAIESFIGKRPFHLRLHDDSR